MNTASIGNDLYQIRKNAKVSQGAVAAKTGLDQSSISRIENGELILTSEDVLKYLASIENDETAADYATHFKNQWTALKKPSYWHPNRQELLIAETTLKRLDAFIATPGVSVQNLEQAKMYCSAIRESAKFLFDTRHEIPFIGFVQVGKTAALCFLTNLLLQDKNREKGLSIKQKAVLEVGAGYTTLCPVHVNSLDSSGENCGRFGIVIQPQSEDEIFRLVSDVCTSFWAMRNNEEKENVVAEEIERALRSMAGLQRRQIKIADETYQEIDPLLELSKTFNTVEELTAKFFTLINNQDRTTCELWHTPPDKEAGLEWLQETYKKINNCRDPKVSLPKRIDVFVPFPLLGDVPLEIECIDTKGVDGTAIRPDLIAHINNPRTIPVLCSLFTADATMLALLAHLVETGRAAACSNRLMFMVLPRKNDAHELSNEDGTPIENTPQGYAIRRGQIRTKLSNFPGGNQLPIPFFNVESDDPAKIRAILLERIKNVRAAQATRLKELAAASDDLIQNHKDVLVIAALAKVNRRLAECLETHRDLPPGTKPVHSRLVDAFNDSHARTVWASTRRSGSWDKLNSYHWIGVGANTNAKIRSDAAVAAIEGVLDNLAMDPECVCVRNYLAELKQKAGGCRIQFLDEVTNRSKEIFRAVLFPDSAHWQICTNYWLEGKGFRNKVTNQVQQWCATPDHGWIHEAVEGITIKDWREFLIKPLLDLCAEAKPNTSETKTIQPTAVG